MLTIVASTYFWIDKWLTG